MSNKENKSKLEKALDEELRLLALGENTMSLSPIGDNGSNKAVKYHEEFLNHEDDFWYPMDDENQIPQIENPNE